MQEQTQSTLSPKEDANWQLALEAAGEMIRPGIPDGKTRRDSVIARSYTINMARKRLEVSKGSLEKAIESGDLPAFVDPEGTIRMPAHSIEDAASSAEAFEIIAIHERVEPRVIAEVLEISTSALRRRLEKIEANRNNPRWGEIRGKLELPQTLREFYEAYQQKQQEKRTAKKNKQEERRRKEKERKEEERERREELRQRLMESFPDWQEEDRSYQHMLLHTGPPNSGKTHDALQRLIDSGTGWYLAPLRLLAFEVFDRLNQRGVMCNLLTGEEYIPIPGATITAATIEMFDAKRSGECVIIDEAQMLADPDRGWAWTRAMMEARAPEIHVIAPPTAQQLIQQMCQAADIPLGIVQHERLAPIKIADRPWHLEKLPPRTILVAFSRRTVLELKTKLERMKRTVSVVYGTLPPEVRRKQADRFAAGETDICIATDAVGMGLNLPADYVCFYEVEKFDGRTNRLLSAGEVQQIGGRAGRYGISNAGEVGAVGRHNLEVVRRLFYAEADELAHARVAPSVEDLEMIPGSLAERLREWASLYSIPPALRSSLTTADLTERIELASMLSDAQVEQLGLERAVKLINAPARNSSRSYWYECALAILGDVPMPTPPEPPQNVNNGADLDYTETCIACADIYLWLSQRQEFAAFAPDALYIRESRMDWSVRIDEALLRQINTARPCRECGRELPSGYRYAICENCYSKRYLKAEGW
jgi:ATP-dependent RNA helicase SUPV3L1/SUV3